MGIGVISESFALVRPPNAILWVLWESVLEVGVDTHF